MLCGATFRALYTLQNSFLEAVWKWRERHTLVGVFTEDEISWDFRHGILEYDSYTRRSCKYCWANGGRRGGCNPDDVDFSCQRGELELLVPVNERFCVHINNVRRDPEITRRYWYTPEGQREIATRPLHIGYGRGILPSGTRQGA